MYLLLAGLGLANQVREGSARGDELLRVLDLRLLLLVQLHLLSWETRNTEAWREKTRTMWKKAATGGEKTEKMDNEHT